MGRLPLLALVGLTACHLACAPGMQEVHIDPLPPPPAPQPRIAQTLAPPAIRPLLERETCPRGSVELSWILVTPGEEAFPDQPFAVLFHDGTIGEGTTRKDGSFHFCDVPAGYHCAEIVGQVIWVPATPNDSKRTAAWALITNGKYDRPSRDTDELRERCQAHPP